MIKQLGVNTELLDHHIIHSDYNIEDQTIPAFHGQQRPAN